MSWGKRLRDVLPLLKREVLDVEVEVKFKRRKYRGSKAWWIVRLVCQNANPENANRYTPLCWAKVFTEQADRLLTEVFECVGLKLDMLTLYSIYLGQGCDPNVKRERLMDRWVT